MNKQLFTFIILLAASLHTTAQIQFHKSYGTTEGSTVRQTSDGGYIAVGTKSGATTGMDIYIFKTDMYGDTLWTKTIENTGYDLGQDVQELPGGGYIISGSLRYTNGSFYQPVLIKTDTAGNFLWTKAYGTNVNFVFHTIDQTTDGGFILGGNMAGLGTGLSDLSLIKTDANGDTLWTKVYGGAGMDVGYCARQTSDGGYILVGESTLTTAGSQDVCMLKTDSIGNIMWSKNYGYTTYDIGYSVKQTTDGGYIIAGFNGLTPSNTDALLIKTDANGDTLWTKCYGGTGDETFFGVEQTSDGGYIAVGQSLSFGANLEGYVVRTNATGDTLWTKHYLSPSTPDLRDVHQTTDGGFILTGTVLVKTDANGNSGCLEASTNTVINPGTIVVNNPLFSVSSPGAGFGTVTPTTSAGVITTTYCMNVGIHEANTENRLFIAPNPSTGLFTISADGEFINGVIRVYNLVGKIIFETQVSNLTKIEIDLRNLSSGTYFFNLSDQNKNYCEKLFIVND